MNEWQWKHAMEGLEEMNQVSGSYPGCSLEELLKIPNA